eukprot:Sdes_comp23674_c0_seq1m21853
MPQQMDIDTKLSMPLDSLVDLARKEKKTQKKPSKTLKKNNNTSRNNLPSRTLNKNAPLKKNSLLNRTASFKTKSLNLTRGQRSVATSRVNARDAILNKRRQLSVAGASKPSPPVLTPNIVRTLKISNLDGNVTQADIKELFSIVGPLQEASLNCDESGRSKGTAEVIFQKGEDALKACKQYNNRNLDGRPMKIDMIVEATKKLQQSIASGIFSAGASRKSIKERLGGFAPQKNRSANPKFTVKL